jgi:hypothetical protein
MVIQRREAQKLFSKLAVYLSCFLLNSLMPRNKTIETVVRLVVNNELRRMCKQAIIFCFKAPCKNSRGVTEEIHEEYQLVRK